MDGTDESREGPGLPERIVARLRHDGPLVVIDVLVVIPAYLIPLVLRFNGTVLPHYWTNYWRFIPIAAGLHLLANYLFGLYGQMWRYASVQEARRVVLAGAAGAIFVLTADEMLGTGRQALPQAVAILGAILAFIGFGGIRFQSRLFAFRRAVEGANRRRVLLVGAGQAGAMILRDILIHPSLGLDAVGFVDDDPRKTGLSMQGVRVLGSRLAIPSIVARAGVAEVLLAIPSATSDLVRDVASACEASDVTLRVLPSIREVVGGRVTIRDLRDLQIEDLLGRKQVATDLETVARLIDGRQVLISGAGGSIGSEIARQVARFNPSVLLLLDHDETHLHDIEADLPTTTTVVSLLADVRDRPLIHDLFQRHRPDVVFHAAAHKHVPILETYPIEALRTNVIGTANVVDAAVSAGVERFVLISTDKAVRPSSVMGASKWLGEQIVRSRSATSCSFCAVRFGNVLGSRGSVIPTFLGQIQRGGPVTVTDPEMRRFFMSLEEAVQLVLQAAALSTGGEVFTLDMGEPVLIIELARRLIRLSGQVPDRDIQIEIVGPRPGEKLVEELIPDDEELAPSGHPGILVSSPPVPDAALLRSALRQLDGLAAEGRADDVGATLKELSVGLSPRVEEALV